ncbi:uncharacterized protein G2W53_033062 [Senna tora]|uniref:Retrotransposon gag domain-containing protein n=1 Tax=Senna tora TaxID=362788 RepID=A0A834T0C3_9FABA|nr:uncharacterized protein G2W53_033062 [Senna tora]
MPRGKKKKVIELSSPQIRKARRRRVIESPPYSPLRIFTPPSSPKGETFKTIETPEMAEEDTRAVEDYATPSAEELQSSISRPTVQATTFKIKPATIHLLQSMGTFGGAINEDPNRHILNFLEICDTNGQNGVSDKAVRLRLFPFSLRDQAREWLQSVPQGSITSWADLSQKFLAKFFPLGKTAKLRADITNFKQQNFESLYEAWERCKGLMRKCPHHGVPKWLQVQTFYNGLFSDFQTNIDAAANGALMAKPVKEAYSLLETMAANNFQWHSDISASAKSVESQNNEALVTLTATIANLATKDEGLSVQKAAHAVNAIMPRCEHCGEGHIIDQCPLALESVQFLANRNANNNSYSNTYNPGWHNHPNFSWTQNSGLGPSSGVPRLPPGFHYESPKDNEKRLKAKAVKEMGRKASVVGGSKDHQIDPGETPQIVITESDAANQSGGPTMIKAPPWCHKSITPHPTTQDLSSRPGGQKNLTSKGY